MMTPDYVKGAVRRYIEEGNGYYLTEMFTNGIPLHSYPETREIITNLLMGKANRDHARPPLTITEKARHYSIIMLVAELHGAGFALISNGNNSKPTACKIASEIHGYTATHIYKHIWKPNRDNETVKRQVKQGADNKESVLMLFPGGI